MLTDDKKKVKEALDHIGAAIDYFLGCRNTDGLHEAIARCGKLEPQLQSRDLPIVWYFRANAHAALSKISGERSEWSWREPDVEAELYYLRRAKAHPAFGRLKKSVRLQILTNLANNLNTLGRAVEALEHFDLVLAIEPSFGMARGNRGVARMSYTQSVFDGGHQSVIMTEAHRDLRAVKAKMLRSEGDRATSISAFFARKADVIEGMFNVDEVRKAINLDKWSLGRSRLEKEYRAWALAARLFLNPLNALGPYPISAADVLVLPTHDARGNEPPHYIAWFNQMVQEYVGARAMFYEGAVLKKSHFADRSVTLVDTLDYPEFSISIEKTRWAFRAAYSLLDKIAGFLNHYLKLGLRPEDVTIRRLWHEGKGLRPQFKERPNWPLRGLYWLSRDIVDDKVDTSTLEPDAQDLRKIRHALEHRALVLRWMDGAGDMGVVETMTAEEFETKTLKLLKLARAALMYLASAVYYEEHSAKDDEGLAVPLFLPTYRRC